MPTLRSVARWPHGIPFPTPWDQVAQAVHDRTLDPLATLRWHVGKPAPVETCAWLLALAARPGAVPFETVRAVLDACVTRGASFYTLPKGHDHQDRWSLLAHVRDPARLAWWLDQGGDPAASAPEGQLQWWAFVDAGRLDLLDVLRQRPAWRRWALARDAQGDNVMNRWAWLDRPPGPGKASSAALAVSTFAWLRQHVPQEDARKVAPEGAARPADDPLLTLWTQALDGEPRSTVVWSMLLGRPDLVPLAEARARWDQWLASGVADSVVNQRGERASILKALGQALEAAELRHALPQDDRFSTALPARPRL